MAWYWGHGSLVMQPREEFAYHPLVPRLADPDRCWARNCGLLRPEGNEITAPRGARKVLPQPDDQSNCSIIAARPVAKALITLRYKTYAFPLLPQTDVAETLPWYHLSGDEGRK
ncbi:hypothetical protein llap_14655 [Limosa lapponica baueri]|uniref:Uncharacterized protein n=1 Tax=Limosa lapponica baueri TaxID=1758121 RepID=A0A2I0TMN3_LIMLA|nr:hypothetical protein llap_14655 [Limosa lapponica baueri]